MFGRRNDALLNADAPTARKVATWVIEPARAGLLARLEEFWRYRRITWFFATRVLSGMYEGTLLGKIWLFRPIIPMLITSLIFGTMLQVPSEDVPYFVFFVAGSSTWMLFERSVLWATRSLDMHKSLVTKVYFPRLVVPVSSVAPAILYFGIFMVVLVGTCVYYLAVDGRWFLVLGPRLLLAPIIAALTVVLALAVGLWTSVWQVRARDVRFGIRYMTQFWLYLTPVIYPLSEVPERYRLLVLLNPMTGYVEAFKWATLGIGSISVRALGISLLMTTLVLLSGMWYFNREEAASIDKL